MSYTTLNFFNTLLALLSLIAIAAAVGLVVFRILRGAEATGRLLSHRGLWLAWAVALVATVGSLIYSEVVHFVPCRLCWFQRIAMYPMSVMLFIGALRRDLTVRLYALPLSFAGLSISVLHYLTQAFPSLESGACDPFNPCSARYVDTFGFISIPFMAGAGFLLITVVLLLSRPRFCSFSPFVRTSSSPEEE